jgi:outer membrane lipoprotein SlyB
MKNNILTSLLFVILLTGCGTNMDSDVVTSRSSAGKVVYGTIASSRAVTIKDSEKLSDNAVGGITGGVVGGVASSNIGKGKGKDAATVGGVIAGAILGAMIEDQLSTSKGFEYIINLETAQKLSTPITKEKHTTQIQATSNPIENDIQSSAVLSDVAVSTLSIVQADETPIPVGTRVMIIYRDDGTRIVPASR